MKRINNDTHTIETTCVYQHVDITKFVLEVKNKFKKFKTILRVESIEIVYDAFQTYDQLKNLMMT